MILRPPRSTLFPYPTLSRSSHEAKRDAVALGDPGDREIGGSTDQRAVAAQASAEREAPPQRLDIVETAIGGGDRERTRTKSSQRPNSYGGFCLHNKYLHRRI